ncbi:hypothetical protein DV735_g3230, partial [Chaetothyriales sp. CBS 134920]
MADTNENQLLQEDTLPPLDANETEELDPNETEELDPNETEELGANETEELGANETEELDPNGDLLLIAGPHRLLVSSKVLQLACPFFQTMLRSNAFLEGVEQPNAEKPPVKKLEEEHPDIFRLICRVLHYLPVEPPGSIDDFGSLADLCHLYGCPLALSFHVKSWMGAWDPTTLQAEDLQTMLWVAFSFHLDHQFQSISSHLAMCLTLRKWKLWEVHPMPAKLKEDMRDLVQRAKDNVQRRIEQAIDEVYANRAVHVGEQHKIFTNHRFGIDTTHIVPKEEREWFIRNGMSRYAAVQDVNHPGNMLCLRSDIHRCFDDRVFSIVPKPEFASDESAPSSPAPQMAYVLHVFAADAEEFADQYHNTCLQYLDQTRHQFLFARFAWTILILIKQFVLAGADRTVVVSSQEPGRTEWIAQELSASKLFSLYGRGGSRSASPKKRGRPDEADGGSLADSDDYQESLSDYHDYCDGLDEPRGRKRFRRNSMPGNEYMTPALSKVSTPKSTSQKTPSPVLAPPRVVKSSEQTQPIQEETRAG